MITINEMTITVPGNVVKNMDSTGKNTLLRMTQEQLQSFYDEVGPMLDFLKSLKNGSATGRHQQPPQPPVAATSDGSQTGV
jgi:hypothetical protein